MTTRQIIGRPSAGKQNQVHPNIAPLLSWIPAFACLQQAGRRIQDILSINDDEELFRLSVILVGLSFLPFAGWNEDSSVVSVCHHS